MLKKYKRIVHPKKRNKFSVYFCYAFFVVLFIATHISFRATYYARAHKILLSISGVINRVRRIIVRLCKRYILTVTGKDTVNNTFIKTYSVITLKV